MSYVTDVLLCMAIGDDGFNDALPELQSWIAENQHSDTAGLKPIDGYAGGYKAIQQDIWAGAFNYLDDDEFIRRVRQIAWERPEAVLLLMSRENDDGFSQVPLTREIGLFEEDV